MNWTPLEHDGARMATAPAAQRSPMATPRGLAGRPMLWILLFGALVTTVLSLHIHLSNSVVNLRREIAALDQELEYLDASYADAVVTWNRACSREAIVSRAEKELGLVTPEGPGTLIVTVNRPMEREIPLWQRALETFGGGGDGVGIATAQSR